MTTPSNRESEQKKKPFRLGVGWYFILLGLALLAPSVLNFTSVSPTTWNEFEKKMLGRQTIAELLLEKETISKEDLENVLGKRMQVKPEGSELAAATA